MRKRVDALLTELDAHISDPEAPVGSLSGGQRQAVAICRALNLNAVLVIMDEPTAALAVAETRKVLSLTRRLAERGSRGRADQPQHFRCSFEVADRMAVPGAGERSPKGCAPTPIPKRSFR